MSARRKGQFCVRPTTTDPVVTKSKRNFIKPSKITCFILNTKKTPHEAFTRRKNTKLQNLKQKIIKVSELTLYSRPFFQISSSAKAIIGKILPVLSGLFKCTRGSSIFDAWYAVSSSEASVPNSVYSKINP